MPEEIPPGWRATVGLRIRDILKDEHDIHIDWRHGPHFKAGDFWERLGAAAIAALEKEEKL